MEKNLGKEEKNLIFKELQDNEYKKSFKLFLKKTNEKRIIFSHIKKEILFKKEMKFLDIGGGDGSFALPISKKVGSTLVIEPNIYFAKKISSSGLNCFNVKWENFNYNKKFDFILAAYVTTHFPLKKFKSLIRKMINFLEKNGTLIIFAVDENEGSWRGVHTYFYELIGLKKKSSSLPLKNELENHKVKKKKIITNVIADNLDEMLKILTFDFGRYGKKFIINKDNIKKYLIKRKRNGKIILKMVHWMYVVKK